MTADDGDAGTDGTDHADGAGIDVMGYDSDRPSRARRARDAADDGTDGTDHGDDAGTDGMDQDSDDAASPGVANSSEPPWGTSRPIFFTRARCSREDGTSPPKYRR